MAEKLFRLKGYFLEYFEMLPFHFRSESEKADKQRRPGEFHQHFLPDDPAFVQKKRLSMALLLHLGMSTLILLSTLFVSATAWSQELITANYETKDGRNILLTINISPHGPNNIIVIQKLPPGVDLIETSPMYRKFNAKKREVKWLLKGARPGRFTIKMTISNRITLEKLRGEIRYRDPEKGTIISYPIPSR